MSRIKKRIIPIAILFILIFITGFLNVEDVKAEPQPTQTKIFGNPNLPDLGALNVAVTEDSDFVIVDNADGLVFKFRKGSAGYNEIWQNDIQIVANEQWVLEYLAQAQWKQRGIPQYVTWEQPEPYHVVVKRFYDDFQGTTFNITYSFHGGFRSKISFEGNIGQADDYRIVWAVSGINKGHVWENTIRHFVEFWNEGEKSVCFDYSDVYETFGNITTVEIDEWAGNHKLNEMFNVGFLEVGQFRLDPTFGNTVESDPPVRLYRQIENYIRGCNFTIPEDGRATKISAFICVNLITADHVHIKAAIYNSTEHLVGYSNEVQRTENCEAWINFTMNNEPLVKDEHYILVVWSEDMPAAGDECGLNYYTHETQKTLWDSETYNSFPQSLSLGDPHENEIHAIYCTYTALPTCSDVDTNTTKAGAECKFYAKWTADISLNMSGYIFGTNNTGSWVNDTWVDLGSDSRIEWSNKTKTLNSAIGAVIQWRIWANDTNNGWGDTGIQSFTITGYDLNLRAMDASNNPITSNCSISITYSGSEHNKTVDSGGWANWTNTFTHNQAVTAIKVLFQGLWVNGTWSITMDSDKTINVTCNVYSLTVYVTSHEGVAIPGASLSLIRNGLELSGLYGLPTGPQTEGFGNTTHARYTWTQLANQTSSYKVWANIPGASEPLSVTTPLTTNTEKVITLVYPVGGGGDGGGGGPAPPLIPTPSPLFELPSPLPIVEEEVIIPYTPVIIMGIIAVLFFLAASIRAKRSEASTGIESRKKQAKRSKKWREQRKKRWKRR